MPTERVLVEIVTAANMAGIEQAKAGFLGLNASTLALTAALGGLIYVGKAAIDNTEKMTKAHLELSQAAAASKYNFQIIQEQFDAWSEANKRYIPDQYAAETALANFVRAIPVGATALEALNVALDLSTLKGEEMATAQETIIKALAGNAKGLKDLGITTEEYNAIWKDKGLTQAQKQVELLQLMGQKTKDGRKAQTDLAQSTQALNHDWQDMTTKIGPPLLSLFGYVADQADRLVTALDDLGHNKSWNENVSKFLGVIQKSIIEDVRWVETVIGDIQRLGNWLGGGSRPNPAPITPPHRAAGGPVSAGMAYLVGERGPEIFTPGSSGGITPNNAIGGTTINIHIGGLVSDGPALDRFANQIIQRVRYAKGT